LGWNFLSLEILVVGKQMRKALPKCCSARKARNKRRGQLGWGKCEAEGLGKSPTNMEHNGIKR